LGLDKTIVLEWARGAGKSTILRLVSKEAVNKCHVQQVFLWVTYQQMLSRTLPSTKAGLDMFGFMRALIMW
jgi:ABC-type phosphate/phosphonate transport system ATPase subunit